AINAQSGDTITHHSVDAAEGAANENIPITLNEESRDRTVRAPEARKEIRIQAAITVETRHVGPGDAIDSREITARNDLAVSLETEREHVRIDARLIKGHITGTRRTIEGLIVNNVHLRIGGRAQQRAGARVRENDVEIEWYRVRDAIIQHVNREGRGRLALHERDELVGDAHVIDSRHRRAVHGGDVHGGVAQRRTG